MKKAGLFVLGIVILLLICSGCGLNKQKMNTTKRTDNARIPSVKNSVQNEIGSNNGKLIYKNLELGYSLEFPESWRGHCLLDESDSGFLRIAFVGESKISKYAESDSKDKSVGITMFYIGSENFIKDEQFIDSVEKIGTARQINYYYFTNTDYPLGVLDTSEQVVSELVYDDQEKQLMQSDFNKARQMEKDIDSIKKTFKPL